MHTKMQWGNSERINRNEFNNIKVNLATAGSDGVDCDYLTY